MIGVIKTDIPKYNWNESLFAGDFHAGTTFDGEMDRTSNMGIFLVSNFGLYNRSLFIHCQGSN